MRKLFVNTSGRCGRMRASACQCAPCHDCHELPLIVHEQLTSSSRVVHDMFTSSSRTVHEHFTTTARQWRSRRCVVYTGLPGHYSPFQRSPARGQLISQRQHARTTKQTEWHDLPRQNRGQKSCKFQPFIREYLFNDRCDIFFIYRGYF